VIDSEEERKLFSEPLLDKGSIKGGRGGFQITTANLW